MQSYNVSLRNKLMNWCMINLLAMVYESAQNYGEVFLNQRSPLRASMKLLPAFTKHSEWTSSTQKSTQKHALPTALFRLPWIWNTRKPLPIYLITNEVRIFAIETAASVHFNVVGTGTVPIVSLDASSVHFNDDGAVPAVLHVASSVHFNIVPIFVIGAVLDTSWVHFEVMVGFALVVCTVLWSFRILLNTVYNHWRNGHIRF